MEDSSADDSGGYYESSSGEYYSTPDPEDKPRTTVDAKFKH